MSELTARLMDELQRWEVPLSDNLQDVIAEIDKLEAPPQQQGRGLAERAKVVCDESDCKWEMGIPWDTMPAWHNKPCPKCGKGIIVNNSDLAQWALADGLVRATKIIDPEGKMPRTKVHFNSSSARNNEALRPPEQQQGREGELAERIVKAIEIDFTDRRGLRQEWEQIDDEVQSEIRERWIEIVEAELTATAPAGEGEESSGTKLNRQTAKQIESDVASGECQIEDIGGLVFTHLQIAQKRGEVLIKRRLSEMVNGRATAPTEKGAGEI